MILIYFLFCLSHTQTQSNDNNEYNNLSQSNIVAEVNAFDFDGTGSLGTNDTIDDFNMRLKAKYTEHDINLLYYVVKKLFLLSVDASNLKMWVIESKLKEIANLQKLIYKELEAMDKDYDRLHEQLKPAKKGLDEWFYYGMAYLLHEDDGCVRLNEDDTQNNEAQQRVGQIKSAYHRYKIRHENACSVCGIDVTIDIKTKLFEICIFLDTRRFVDHNTTTKELWDKLNKFDDYNDDNDAINMSALFNE